MARQRRSFVIARRFAEADRFVCLDESGAQTNMTRRFGRSPIGQRCYAATPHGHWKTTTMLSAIRTTGVIREATVVFDGATNAMIFHQYVEQHLVPSLRPGDIVVMDNLASHKAAGVVEAIEAVDASVWYLPPYSPDLNPIEKMWSKVKTLLRAAEARTVEQLIQAIGHAMRRVSNQECINYFANCGYGA